MKRYFINYNGSFLRSYPKVHAKYATMGDVFFLAVGRYSDFGTLSNVEDSECHRLWEELPESEALELMTKSALQNL